VTVRATPDRSGSQVRLQVLPSVLSYEKVQSHKELLFHENFLIGGFVLLLSGWPVLRLFK